jgi:putative nucleotidyltransferase with HDIG domain
MQRVKVEISDLKVGMYVSQLDRPWLGTPFLFQGFELQENSDIKLLQQYCQHIYIDITRSSLTPDEIEKSLNPSDKLTAAALQFEKPKVAIKPSFLYRLLGFLSRFDFTGKLANKLEGSKAYRIKTSLKKEVPHAADAYELAQGAVNDVLDSVRVGRAVDIEQVRESVNPMIESVLRNPGAMTWFVLLKKRDAYSYSHSIASSVWATVLGRHLGFDRPTLSLLALGGLLLDVGKARLPEELLQKKSAISESERRLLREHVEIGLEMVRDSMGIGHEVLDMIASHHERHDGSGYPRGLEGSDIPVYGRIAGLIDCYDAMTSYRPYAAAMSSYEAIRELNSMAGVHFQKELVEQFVQALGMFPAGSVVELNSGEIGIVVEQNRVRRLRPKIMVLLDTAKQPLKKHKVIDLRKVSGDSREKKSAWILTGHEPGAFGIDPAHYFIG